MLFEGALTALLLADPGIAALTQGRVHWRRLPASVSGRPYVNLRAVSGGLDYHLEGPSGLEFCRIQADCWDGDVLGAKGLSRALIGAVAGFVGVTAGIDIQSAMVVLTRDGEGEIAAGAEPLFSASVDIAFSWKPAG